ncbi:MAG: winged helix-turn-helix transcriptional regulator [Verrucomicrobia bacterium]|nr:winged helix-turn-helix transcriptional regulator [Verrucomicrobiota bacterium]
MTAKTSRRVSEIGKAQRLKIIHALKRTQGLSIAELTERMNLSYMGVKQHCEELERQGVVDTWRRPKGVGRPELVYRLTRRAQSYFPQAGQAVTIELLEASKRLYGPTAPEKLLFALFTIKAERYVTKISAHDLPGRLVALAKLREEEGFLSEATCEPVLALVDYHCPITELVEAFPLVRRLEKEMLERVLGVTVERAEKTASGLYECRFTPLVPQQRADPRQGHLSTPVGSTV